MDDLNLIRDLGLIWTASLLVGLLFSKLKQPVIAGYMLVGVLIGPHVFKLISEPEQIKVLSEFGVAMLLFALGVDLSLKQVLNSARRTVGAALLQIVATIAVAWAIASLTGLARMPAAGLLFGCICAISSSVVISRVLIDRGELDSIHGQILIPLALVQDLSLVVIIPFMPVLEQSTADWSALLFSTSKAFVFVLAVIFGSIKLVPHLLAWAAKTNSRELFLLTLLVLCLGVALLSKSLGLSIALGAFLAGIMMCESSYAHQALHDVSPLRDVFSTVFFVSVGMLLDPNYICQHWLQVILFVLLLIPGKIVIGAASALLATKNFRSAVLVGVGLAQIGEFSFVLLTMGYESKLINESIYNLFFAGAIISMIASPGLMAVFPKLLSKFNKGDTTDQRFSPVSSSLKNHVVLCGFGRSGRNLGLVLESYQLPFIVVELNASIVEELAVSGIKHIYGDAMSPGVLSKCNIGNARVLVITIPDPFSATAVATYARKHNPKIKIIARAHKTDDMRILREAGANAVVQPEFEASIEITRLVLYSIKRSESEIQAAMEQIITRRYALFQPELSGVEFTAKQSSYESDQLGIWYRINESANEAGKSIRELRIREETGATITAVKRGKKITAYPDPGMELLTDDEFFAIGSSSQLEKLENLFEFEKQSQDS